jgi:hypothetical protein
VYLWKKKVYFNEEKGVLQTENRKKKVYFNEEKGVLMKSVAL